MKINILTNGYLSPNSRGWLFPIIKNRSRLKDLGVEVSFYFKYSERIKSCDVVIVESKFVLKNWSIDKSKIFDLLKKLKTNKNKVFYFELNDSTFCWALEALPYVDKLLKPFIFKDKSNYCRPIEGHTIISDYYYKNKIINSYKPISNKNSSYMPTFVKKEDLHYLNKIQVGFNAAFADHSSDSMLWKSDYFTKINRRFFNSYSKKLKSIKSYEYINPEKERMKNISCRIWSDGYNKAIAYHRNQTKIIFKDYISTKKLDRKDYFSEMRNSKVVDVIKELESFSCKVEVFDPYISSVNPQESNLKVIKDFTKKRYSAVIIAVAHREFYDISGEELQKCLLEKNVVFDLKSILPEKYSDLRL